MHRGNLFIPLYGLLAGFLFFFNTTGIKPYHPHKQISIAFRDTTFAFGSIQEGNIVSHVFRFVNRDSVPAEITSFHASCGCTTSDYDPGSVKPGKTGKITVVFDSEGQPGHFNKEAVITTNIRPYTIRLHITGTVLPRPMKGTNVMTIGHVRFSPGILHIKLADRSIIRRITVQNAGAKPIHITAVHAPSFMKVRFPGFPLLTGEKIFIPVRLSFPKLMSYNGQPEDSILFKTDDQEQPVKVIHIILSHRGSLKALGPEIHFRHISLNAGNAIENQMIRVSYRFTNTGDKPLKIYSIIPSCGCTHANIDKSMWKPGKGGMIRVQMDTHGKTGSIQKEILVQSNAVNDPTVELKLMVRVKAHPTGKQIMNSGKANLFKGNCRSCHFNPAVGKKGEMLYGSICRTCHGPAAVDDGMFHPGTRLNVTFLESKTSSELFNLIAWGTPDSIRINMMPGFLDKAGGPLSNAQVRSLVRYLKSTVKNH